MFGKSYSWWFGKNSFWHHVGAQDIIAGRLGASGGYPQAYQSAGFNEANFLKYGMIGLAGYVIIKAVSGK